MPKTPNIVSISSAQLEELLAMLAGLLPQKTYQLVESLLRTLQWLMELIQTKQTTIERLQRLIFGAKTEKTSQLFPKTPTAAACLCISVLLHHPALWLMQFGSMALSL